MSDRLKYENKEPINRLIESHNKIKYMVEEQKNTEIIEKAVSEEVRRVIENSGSACLIKPASSLAHFRTRY